MKKIILTLLIFSSLYSRGQNPAPAEPQKEAVLIMNAIAHIGNGEVIQNSVVGLKNGKISLVGDVTKIKVDKNEYPIVISAFGKHIYPGFIECNSSLGLTEFDLVRSTRDNY